MAAVLDRGRIIVGTSPDYPPFEYVDATTDRLAGFDVELATAIAERLGVAVEWKMMPFPSLLDALDAREVDAVIACLEVRPERLDQADFTGPYLVSRDVVLARTGSGIVLGDLSGLAAYRVGVRQRTAHAEWCRLNLVAPGLMPETNLSVFPSVAEAVAALEAGGVDVILIDEGVADLFAGSLPVEKVFSCLLPGDPAVAVRKGETRLRGRLDEIIAALREEGRVSQLAEKYGLAGP